MNVVVQYRYQVQRSEPLVSGLDVVKSGIHVLCLYNLFERKYILGFLAKVCTHGNEIIFDS